MPSLSQKIASLYSKSDLNELLPQEKRMTDWHAVQMQYSIRQPHRRQQQHEYF